VVIARSFATSAPLGGRAQADAAARESRERFQTSIETLSDPLVSLGPLRDHR
jgi:hypothetical protein